MRDTLDYRLATSHDLDGLVALEMSCFANDQLSRRSFKRWLTAKHGTLLIAVRSIVGDANAQDAGLENEAPATTQTIVGYGLLWCHKGTRLARLYSLAVSDSVRGRGVAMALLSRLEGVAKEQQRIYMRLEVSKANAAAIALYRKAGYTVFGEYFDYYEDHSDALRMQKRIMQLSSNKMQRAIPWYQQTTEFTCGPASLMMAMFSLNEELVLSQELELDLWREATTIFMTSGHGGCHPIGLALAADARNFNASAYINTDAPLFVDGVRNEEKRSILNTVHQHFVSKAQQQKVDIHYQEITQNDIEHWLSNDCAVLMLISTYRLDGKKAPHWVCISGMDDSCFYVHDPDPSENEHSAIDCQYLPIARNDFDLMSAFGSNRLRSAVVLQGLKVS